MNGSIINGGHSGIIRINSDKAGLIMHITYPNQINLSSGSGTVMVDGFSENSTTNALLNAGDIEANVGGIMHLKNEQANGSYSGSISFQILISE